MDILKRIWKRLFSEQEPQSSIQQRQSLLHTRSRSPSSSKIVLCSPLELDQTEDVVDLLQSGCAVLLNLERDRYDVARRLLDFVAGVAYHNENQIQRVAPRAFLIAPYDAEIEEVNCEDLFT